MRLRHIPATYRVTVKGLARDGQGRLLFVRERGDTWDLPGGGLEPWRGVARGAAARVS